MSEGRLMRLSGGLLSVLGISLAAAALPGGPIVTLLGLFVLSTAEQPGRAIQPGTLIWALVFGGVLLDGFLLAHGAGLVATDLTREDDVRLRMLRLARVASLALPLLAWLARGLWEGPDATLRWARAATIAVNVAALAMPSVLVLSALVSMGFKWLLPIPANAAVFGMACAALSARRDLRLLEVAGFGAILASMVAGLGMGCYAFDGPLPELLGAYSDPLRTVARSFHAIIVVGGLAAVLLSRVLHPALRPVVMRPGEEAAIARLNKASVERSFIPGRDLDYGPEAMTTDLEFGGLYPAWSLLQGTGADAELGPKGRVAYSKYQQMNLMCFTGLLERHGLSALNRLYDLDPSPEFSEYVGHFIKEETYHHQMFTRAIQAIHATMPGLPPLPMRGLDLYFRLVFFMVGLVPHEKLRTALSFTLFRWAERVTMDAHRVASRTITRSESLVPKVWRLHAIDEARHITFDGMIVDRCCPSPAMQRVVTMIVAVMAVSISLLLNGNELWAARTLGLRLHLWHLPRLIRRTQAPFKRKVFDLITDELRGRPRAREEPLAQS